MNGNAIEADIRLRGAKVRVTLRPMDEKAIEGSRDPEEAAARLGLKVMQWHGGGLYARDENVLYLLYVKDERVVVDPQPALSGYVGEEFHTPRQAAVHAGLTVVEELANGDVMALDGFGRKYLVHATGNGPQAKHHLWATEEELKTWAPRHAFPKPTAT